MTPHRALCDFWRHIRDCHNVWFENNLMHVYDPFSRVSFTKHSLIESLVASDCEANARVRRARGVSVW
jgi:hypothetical protein